MTEKYTLEKIEQELTVYEDPNIENPVQLAWENACKILNIIPTSAQYVLGNFLSGQNWFKERTNPYHNGVHTAQVMHSGAVLFALEKETNSLILDKHIADKVAPYFLIALMYHDYKHPGRPNKEPFELEQLSFDLFSKFILFDEGFYEIWTEDLEFEIDEDLSQIRTVVSNLILATEVSQATKHHRDQYLKEKEDKEMEVFTVLSVLMSEADLMSSVLPVLGKQNGQKLAQELDIPMIATDIGRSGFLKTVKYVSFAAESLGVQKMIDEEIVELLK